MTLVVLAEILLGLWLATALLYQIASEIALCELLSRAPQAPKTHLPSATILTSLDEGIPRLEENLRQLCETGAPVLVGAKSGSEAFAAAQRVHQRVPDGTLRIVNGSGLAGSNRKIATLIPMMPEAHGEILIFTDADIGVPKEYLETVLSPFADSDVGMVTSPYRSVGGASVASRVDAMMTNTAFLPAVALASRIEGVRFALGATMAIRRTVLDQIGGLEPMREVLADDWSLADRARRAGHRIVLAPLLLDHHIGETGWAGMWQRHLRWARTMRALRPSGYAGTFVAHGLAPALGLMMMRGWSAASAGALAAWLLVRTGTVLLNARRTGCGASHLVLLPVADLISLALFVGGLSGRTVQWGESRLRVGAGGTILSTEPQPDGAPRADYVA